MGCCCCSSLEKIVATYAIAYGLSCLPTLLYMIYDSKRMDARIEQKLLDERSKKYRK
ncbi:unnamed protein product [Rhodiola kirilowii]